MVAQGYQESQLDQSAKSHVGAVGVMQVMPATGKDLAVGDIHQIEPNIHAGVKYFRFMMDQYYKNEPMDALNKGLSEEAVQKRLADLGAESVEPARRGPKALAALVKSEAARLLPILKAATDK